MWGGFATDFDRGLIFLTTSNPTPTLVGVEQHKGDNLFSSSLVAFSIEKNDVPGYFRM